jgi:GntP family gluconate:H+ symporter
MPLAQSFVFLAAIVALVVATQWRQFHPFLAIAVVATLFGYIVGFPTGILGHRFGLGFSEMMYSPGLVIVGAALVAGLAESTTASDRLMTMLHRWPRLGANRIAALIGLVGGIGASPAAAFALLTPLLRPIGGQSIEKRERAAVALALAISGSHGLIWLTPVPIAAAAIIGAVPERVALFGIPLAIVLAAVSAVFARNLPRPGSPSPASISPPPLEAAPEPGSPAGKPLPGYAVALVLATALPLVLLMIQSIGDNPREPLGGGPTRELIIGVGRPLILFLVGVGVMVLAQPRQSFTLLGSSTWTTRIFANIAGILLVVCAAGGFQKLCQETGMADMFAERVLGWHPEVLGGIMVPFLLALTIKTLQGSSLVAAITAAGMMQPLLQPLGLADTNGKALAALAVGIGAMTISHVNDEYFWLVTGTAGFRPLRGLATLSFGTLLQGLVALVLLLLVSVVASHA